MPEITKFPQDLQPEMAALIPSFVENLGNAKVRIYYNDLGYRSQVHP